jgi:hypothetical protein
MVILDSYRLIDIPTDSEELAMLLYTHARDWAECLNFISCVAMSRGIVIKQDEVAEIVKQHLYGDSNDNR